MEVTKDEQRKLDDLFRKIADRDEFVAQQRQAAETLRRKEAEPPVTVWVVVDNYTLRDWGQEGFGICGVYLTLDEAVAAIHAERNRHTSEGPLMPIEGEGEFTRWDYSDWDTAHNYGIEQAPILSTFKTDGQPLPEDSVIFQKGVAEGRRLERDEQKMDDAESGVVSAVYKFDDIVTINVAHGGLNTPLYLRLSKYKGLKEGDKVKLIIIKEDEK